MTQKKLNKVVLDSLSHNEWLPIDNPLLPAQSWEKNGVVLSIYAARTMRNMYHVAINTTTMNDSRFMHIDQLTKVIEGDYK